MNGYNPAVVHLNADFATRIERAVADVEARTNAEIVVVASSRSGTYSDVASGVGIVAGLALLTFQLLSPFVFPAAVIPVDVAVTIVLVAWLTDKSPTLLRLVTPTRRLRAQAHREAERLFFVEAVHGTRQRTGLLVHVSALEQVVTVLPDGGLLARIPGGGLQSCIPSAHTLDELVAGLHRLGDVLAVHCPATGENPDEIGNAPRVIG